MLELPELETISAGLSAIVGRHIRQINIIDDNFVENGFTQSCLLDKRIYYLFRSGSIIVFVFRKSGKTSFAAVKLSHSSKVIVSEKQPSIAETLLASFGLGELSIFIYDSFKDIKLFYLPEHDYMREFLNIHGDSGKDFLKINTQEDFIKLLRKFSKDPQLTIESFFRSSDIIQNIGPYLTSEILHECNIHPHSKISNMENSHFHTIYKATNTIISSAIKHRGASINGYLDAFGNPGAFQKHLKVYNNPDAYTTDLGIRYFNSSKIL